MRAEERGAVLTAQYVNNDTKEDCGPLRHVGEEHHGASERCCCNYHDKRITIFDVRQFTGADTPSQFLPRMISLC